MWRSCLRAKRVRQLKTLASEREQPTCRQEESRLAVRLRRQAFARATRSYWAPVGFLRPFLLPVALTGLDFHLTQVCGLGNKRFFHSWNKRQKKLKVKLKFGFRKSQLLKFQKWKQIIIWRFKQYLRNKPTRRKSSQMSDVGFAENPY